MSKVLIVDDDPQIRRIVCLLLKGAGHEVLEADDGQVAFEVALSHGPDVIFLDIAMPNAGGMAALNLLQNHSYTETIPVIMLSANDSTEAREQCMRQGASHFVAKPWKTGELERAVQFSTKREPALAGDPAAGQGAGENPSQTTQALEPQNEKKDFVGNYFTSLLASR